MPETDARKASMAPIARADARLFLLGSLPGDASLAAQQYYAHPTNQFWRLLGGAIGAELHALPYRERLETLAEHRVGLWDVIASAMRDGSLDQALREPGHNPIGRLVHDFPELRAVAFNGKAASTAGRKLLGQNPRVTLIDLPSSSAANTRPFAEKAVEWAKLGRYLGAQGCSRAGTP